MPSPVYYIGTPPNLGKAHPSDAYTFEDLYQRYLFSPRALPTTRDEFLRLTTSQKHEIKKVDFLIPCTLQSGSTRKTENAGPCNLIILDIDNSTDALPLARSSSYLLGALAPFAYVAYHTASSTKDGPRIRIVVSAEGIPPEHYKHAVNLVSAQVGIKPNPESLDVVRAMYFPTVFSDSTRQDQIVFSFNLGGKPVGVSDVEFYLENLELYHGSDYGADVPDVDTRPVSFADASGNVLEYLRAPLDGVTVDLAREALSHLDADSEGEGGDAAYHTWIRVGMGLKHQFGGGEDAEDAFDLFDEWSAQGSKDLYPGRDSVLAKWRSFKVHATGRNAVTFRSVLQEAKRNGWASEIVPEGKDFAEAEAVLNWLGAESKRPTFSVYQTLEKAVSQYVRAVTEESAMVDESFCAEAIAICKAQAEGCTLAPAAIKKSIKEQRKKAVELDKLLNRPADSDRVPGWIRGVVWVISQGRFVSLTPAMSITPPVFNDTFAMEMPKSGYPLQDNGRPICMPADFAMNIAKIPIAVSPTFDPGKHGQALIRQGDGSYLLNTYVDTRPPADAKRSKAAGEILERHMGHLFADYEHGRILLDYMAWIVQNPGKKIRWAPFIQGTQGCGKSVLHEIMACALGEASCHRGVGSAPFTRFQSFLEGRQFVTFDEVAFPIQSGYAATGALKSMMTDATISIEKKGIDSYSVPNLLNFLFLSNSMKALPVEDDDRRYMVLHSAIQTAEAAKEVSATGHFAQLWRLVEKHPGAARHYLENRRIDNSFQIDRAPDTDFKKHAVVMTAPRARQHLEEIVDESEDPLLSKDFLLVSLLTLAMRQRGFRGTADAYYNDLINMGMNLASAVVLPAAFRDSKGGNPRRHIWVSKDLMTNYNLPAKEAAETHLAFLADEDLQELL